MKKQIAIIAALTTRLAIGGEPFLYLDYTSALPLMAGVCDIIGIGEIEARSSTNAMIRFSQYWFGDPQTNTLDVNASEYLDMPIAGTNCLFFLSTHSMIADLNPVEMCYAWMFDMECFRGKYQSDVKPYLFGDNRSWVYATEDNADIINWCSNLVQAAQINTDMLAFYELIRDGYRLNPPSSRMHCDSKYAFQFSGKYMSTNFMQQVWPDTNLTGWARAWLNTEYQDKTHAFMAWPGSNAGQQ